VEPLIASAKIEIFFEKEKSGKGSGVLHRREVWAEALFRTFLGGFGAGDTSGGDVGEEGLFCVEKS
jgi:hypothetical protein